MINSSQTSPDCTSNVTSIIIIKYWNEEFHIDSLFSRREWIYKRVAKYIFWVYLHYSSLTASIIYRQFLSCINNGLYIITINVDFNKHFCHFSLVYPVINIKWNLISVNVYVKTTLVIFHNVQYKIEFSKNYKNAKE